MRNTQNIIKNFILEGIINQRITCPSCSELGLFEFANKTGKISCLKCGEIDKLSEKEIIDDFNSKACEISNIIKKYETDNFKLQENNISSLQGFTPLKDTLVAKFTLGNESSRLIFEYNYDKNIIVTNSLKSKFHQINEKYEINISYLDENIKKWIDQWKFENKK